MKKCSVYLIASLAVLIIAGCGKQVKRIKVEKEIDLSGKWNDTDSRLVSEEIISDCLSRPWIKQHKKKTEKNPTVIVGSIVNKTDEHIISETFTKDLEKAFINSGRVQVVASSAERKEIREERKEHLLGFTSGKTSKEFGKEVGADFMLKGVINSIMDKEGRKSVIFYQIDLELIDMETNRKVWIGDKKIKKYIRK